MSEVMPAGWLSVPLADLLEGIETGKSFKCEERPPTNEEIGVVKVSAVSWGAYREEESKTCTDAGRVNPDLFVQKGDFLFSRANTIELVGACVIAQDVNLKLMLSDKILRFRFPAEAMKAWVLHLLRSDGGRKQIEMLASGNQESMRNIGQERIGQIRVPLPPEAEQARIVEKLEELLSDLDAGVAELKAAQRKLARYRQSLLQAAMETSTSGSIYTRVPLGDLVVSIGQGWSPKCEGSSADSGWAVIKTTAIQPLSFNGSHNKKLPNNLKPREHLELKSGDLLVTRAGPRSRVGITCLVRKAREKLILCDKAYRIRCDESRINPAFLELVLNAPSFVNEVDRLKTGINDSGLNLTQDRFFALSIPLPSLDKQTQIIEALALQNQVIAAQEEALAKGLDQAAAQRKNLLKAAFAGQLVPQDSNDEPASELLARIRAERASNDGSAPRRRRKTA